jgi:phospholipid/cholesterol/gamma-HCH transport system permease protein
MVQLQWVRRSLGRFGHVAGAGYGIISLLGRTFCVTVSTGRRGFWSLLKQIVGQILYTGVEAFWLVGVVGLLSGVTIVMQAMTNMPQFGVGQYFGNILVMVVVRELGPFFTALVVIGRSGSALAAYIGNMRVTREIDALSTMGIDPVHFLVLPAFFGTVVSLICLNVYFDVIAIGGGLLVARLAVTSFNVPFMIFAERVLEALTLWDLLVSFFKGTFFGAIIAIVSCYFGLQVRSIRQVPQASLKAVVVSMVVMLFVNVLVTLFFYMVFSGQAYV